jgi:hypothetical protein
MAAALAVDLPLRAEALRDPVIAERFVRATLRPQVDVTHPAPPYFQFDALDDGWLEANLSSIRIARRLRPGKRLAIFVRGSMDALVSGALASAALRYSQVLPEGALVFLGVAGLHPEESAPEVLAQYLRVVEAFDDAGFDVVADRVDALAPAAVAFGAVGAAGGTRIYRTIPPTPFWENEYSVKVLVKYLCPVRGDRMRSDVARKRLGRGSIEPCPVTGCSALDEPLENADLRSHHGHLTQHELTQARERGVDWVARRYENSPIKAVRVLGHAVRLARRRSAEA